MTAPTATPTIDRAAKEAIGWEALLRGGDATAAEREQFEVWRRSDGSNEAAWARLQERLVRLRGLQGGSGNAIRRALDQPNPGKRRLLKAGASVAGLVLAGIATRRIVSTFSLDADFHNPAKVPETLALSGGLPPVTLGASARVYTEGRGAGDIYLASGQIATDGGAAKMTPLSITSRDGLVLSNGARLSVDVLPAHTVVAVQGGDAILSARQGARVHIADGTAWSMTARRVAQMPETSADIFSWTEGKLVVLNRGVPDVVATLGRYFHGYISFPQVALERRVSGVFPLNDPHAALQQLAEGLGLSVTIYGNVLAVATAV
ncbi:transmembrane sensor [Paraburkholderia sp. GAS333]|uniref:FecR family protein n=1 Tax=Paraburkholderia sp. GAS333 TaxID=3156279 RepID=UPI003D2212DC